MHTKLFSDLLDVDFPWPKAGDKLFAQSPHWAADAIIRDDPTGRLVAMARGYKLAADILVESTTASGQQNFLLYPIAFNYRHYLELTMKVLILIYGQDVGVDPVWNRHNLSDLWKAFRKILEGYDVADPRGTDSAVEICIDEFTAIDPESYDFRYSSDAKGLPLRLKFDRVDLKRLADTMKGIDAYFSGCDGYLDALRRSLPRCS